MDGDNAITSWQQAFQDHPVPHTRAIEKQLRSNVSRDKEKLRSLVGGSYRELLATAEAIVLLDRDSRIVEENLSGLGQKCRPPIQDVTVPPSAPRTVILAQLRFLQHCFTTANALLKSKQILPCSQLLVVSRLLLKSPGSVESAVKPLELLRNKIGVFRQRLLRHVDAQLASPTTKNAQLLDALCSYSLITSGSSDDALGHLRQLRLERLRRLLKGDDLTQHRICDGLRYQITSLQTFRHLFGRPISEAMGGLQKWPILQDPAIQKLDSLDLDRISSLIPDEILSFVPYFKRSALPIGEIQVLLNGWSSEALLVLSDALNKQLSLTANVESLLQFRKELYLILLPSYFSTPASPDILVSLRKTLNDKISHLCGSQASQLDQISTLLTQASSTRPRSLWTSDIAQPSHETGASKHIRQVKNRHLGLSGSLPKLLKATNKWAASMQTLRNNIDGLSSLRWRDSIEEPDDEQEEDALAVVNNLTKQDPEMYTLALKESVHGSLESFEKSVVEVCTSFNKGNSDIAPALALLRGIRIATGCLRPAFSGESVLKQIDESIPQLHQFIAADITQRLADAQRESYKAKNGNVTCLENMPSPRAFGTLRTLCSIMLEVGGVDIWSSAAVRSLKEAVKEEIFHPERKSWYADNAFDRAYLQLALSQDVSGDSNVKSPTEYWNRTKLLFGPLLA